MGFSYKKFSFSVSVLFFPWTFLFRPASFLPIIYICFIPAHSLKHPHYLEKYFRFQGSMYFSILSLNDCGKLCCLLLNSFFFLCTDSIPVYCPDCHTIFICLCNSPEKGAVCHILIGAFHSAACCRRNADCLLVKHSLFRTMHHPSISIVV